MHKVFYALIVDDVSLAEWYSRRFVRVFLYVSDAMKCNLQNRFIHDIKDLSDSSNQPVSVACVCERERSIEFFILKSV